MSWVKFHTLNIGDPVVYRLGGRWRKGWKSGTNEASFVFSNLARSKLMFCSFADDDNVRTCIPYRGIYAIDIENMRRSG